MKLYSLIMTDFKMDGGAMFGVIPKTLWSRFYPSDEKNLCTWVNRCLLVVDEKRKILIDNSFGDKQGEKFFRHFHLSNNIGIDESLKRHKFSTEEITDVVLTHLHSDHCGGSIKRVGKNYETTFPNANYWVSKAQWEWAINPNIREASAYPKENILPLKTSGQLKFVEKNTKLFPNFDIRIFNGHTRGQIIPFIKYNNKTIVFTADLIPSSAHIPLLYNMAYDVEPMHTLKEKELFLKEAVEKNYILFLEHDKYIECCTLKESEKGITINAKISLKDI